MCEASPDGSVTPAAKWLRSGMPHALCEGPPNELPPDNWLSEPTFNPAESDELRGDAAPRWPINFVVDAVAVLKRDGAVLRESAVKERSRLPGRISSPRRSVSRNCLPNAEVDETTFFAFADDCVSFAAADVAAVVSMEPDRRESVGLVSVFAWVCTCVSCVRARANVSMTTHAHAVTHVVAGLTCVG